MSIQLARGGVASLAKPRELVEQAHRDGIRKLVVRGIVEDEEGRILLLRRHDHMFRGGADELFGGGVLPGERLRQALRREGGEELGEGFRIYGKAPVVHFHDGIAKSGVPVRSFVFAVTVKGEHKIRINPGEHMFYNFVRPEAMRSFNVESGTIDAVERYLELGLSHAML